MNQTIRTDNSAVIANMQKQIDGLKREKEMLVEALAKLSDMGGECLDSTQMREFAKEALEKLKGE